jgi:hypothetical protein
MPYEIQSYSCPYWHDYTPAYVWEHVLKEGFTFVRAERGNDWMEIRTVQKPLCAHLNLTETRQWVLVGPKTWRPDIKIYTCNECGASGSSPMSLKSKDTILRDKTT